MKTGKAILGVFAGLAAGAILGMLFAPDRGSKVRGKMSRKGEDLSDAIAKRIEEKFGELADSIRHKKGSENQPGAGKFSRSETVS